MPEKEKKSRRQAGSSFGGFYLEKKISKISAN
jgi:hypothetical protein